MSAADLGIAYQLTFWVGFGDQPKVIWCESREQAGRALVELVGHCDRVEFVVVQRMKFADQQGGSG